MSKALWGDAGPATDAALDDASALLDTTAAPDGLPVSPPDISKLARSTEDALTTAGVYKDDALIVDYRRLRKRYHTDHGRVADVLEAPGCVIRLWPSDPHGGRS